MPRYDFDLITIGAGSGGVAGSRRAGSYGARVAIVEESRIGGTCVLRGCVPKKLLVYGAQFADAFADAAGFGWSVAPPRFDWPSLIGAKNKELDRLEQIYVNMLKNSGFGSEVVEIIRREELLYGFDDDIRVALAQEMRGRGIEIHTRTQITRIEKDPHEGYTVFTGIGQEISADLVMYATGRGPNTRGLGLDAVGVETNDKGAVLVDEWQRSSVSNVYAVGDVTDRLNLTPVAIGEGRAIAETLYNNNPIKMDHADVPTAVFSQPPIGTGGLTEEQARRQCGDDVDIYCARFKPMKNTLSGRDERTFMKLVVDGKTDRVLGCHMIGVDAPEIIQGLAIAMNCGASKRMFDQTVGLHPSAAEEFVTMREKFVRPQKQAAE